MPVILVAGASALAMPRAFSQGESLKNGLVSYWPLDVVEGPRTPDLRSGYDLILENLGPAQLVAGKYGSCFSFSTSGHTLLRRVHAPADDLPAIKHASHTVSLWAWVGFQGQSDERIFGEALQGSSGPLFTIGVNNTGSNGAVDLLIRQTGRQPTVDHALTTAQPLDGSGWKHILLVQTEQPDGSATRRFYINGVLDPLIPASRANGVTYNMNTTAVGGVFRATGSAWIDGLIDDVAIWKRALTEAEITDLYTNGMPPVEALPQPLAIKTFEADFDRNVPNGQVTLRWEVSKDAVITLDPGGINLTPLSSFGIGSATVNVAAPTTYTLTISRGAEAPVVRSISVGTISGVADGWNWIEDFESRTPGFLGGQGNWFSPDGIVNVAAAAGTPSPVITSGEDLASLELRSLAIGENQQSTLFFRFFPSSADPNLPVDLTVGLTEKPIRSATDFGGNMGPALHFARVAGGSLVLQARNGPGSPWTTANYPLAADKAYNVWMDVQNNPLPGSDTFNIHIAPDGGARSLLFGGYLSDRAPGEVRLLGFPRPVISHLFISAPTGNQASQAVLLDDFYLSGPNTLNSSVPVPSAFTGPGAGDFRITGFTRNPATGAFSLTWNSEPEVSYSIWTSTSLSGWQMVEGGIPSQGTITTHSPATVFPDGKRYFQIRR